MDLVAFAVTVAIFATINVLLAKSYDLVQSHGGMFSIAHATLFGTGAYTFTVLTVREGVPIVASISVAMAAAGMLGAAIARLTARLGGDYLVIGTLALQYLLIDIASNTPLLGGEYGISGIPRLVPPDVIALGQWDFLILTLVTVGISYLLIDLLIASPWGLSLRAVRDDEVSAKSIGLDPATVKVQCMAVGSAFAGLAGVLYSSYLSFIDPPSFSLEAIYILLIAMVVIGGPASRFGPLVGALLVTLMPEALRFLNVSTGLQGPLRQLIAGLLLIGFAMFRPQGLVGSLRRTTLTTQTAPRRVRTEPVVGHSVASALAPADGSERADDVAIGVKDLEKRFGGVLALRELSFNIRSNATTAVIGPNGAGKTTVFNILTGYLRPDAGQVVVDKLDVSRMRPDRIARMGVGRMFQDGRVFPQLTVLENVKVAAASADSFGLWRTITGVPILRSRARLWRRVSVEILDFVGLRDKLDQRAGELSGGQQKALAIARLLALDAGIMLLDEPTAGLDLERVNEIKTLIRRLQGLGKTIVIVEHRLTFVADICSWAICLAGGEKLIEGPVDDVLQHSELRRVYLGV